VLRPVPSPRRTTTVLWGGEGGPSAGALVQAAVRPGAVLRRLRARPSEACTHLCAEPRTWSPNPHLSLNINLNLNRTVFEGSKIVTVAAGGYHTMAVGVNGALWAWGAGYSGMLGLGDAWDRRVPTLVGAEEVFLGSKVRVAACGNDHTLAVTEAGELWAWGRGAHMVPTRVDPQHFAYAPISAVAAGFQHSAAVTAGGAPYGGGGAPARAPWLAPPRPAPTPAVSLTPCQSRATGEEEYILTINECISPLLLGQR